MILYQTKEGKEEIQQKEEQQESFEFYYCDEFIPTDNKDYYEKHVVLSHDRKLAYPSLAYLKKMNMSPKGKSWEI